MLQQNSRRVLLAAAAGLAAAALASPLAAQQSGRMQVTATVLDVRSSLDVVKALRNHLEQPVKPESREHRPRAWMLLTDARQPAQAVDKPRPLGQAVTIFYF
jgi:hypothetical protein